MNHKAAHPIFLCLVVMVFHLSCNPTQQLFEESQPDWNEYGTADWEFSDSEITATIEDGLGFLMTTQPFDNFSLELEFFPDQTINSGVFIRCATQKLDFTSCYEFNIWDDCPDNENGTGALVRRAKPLARVETKGKWNSYKIVVHDKHIQAWINGILTVDTKDISLDKGFIGIQAYSTGTIRFRNINIKTIKS